MIVYVITCHMNGKHYIGKSTRTLAERWKEHVSESRQCRKDWLLYHDMRKYGVDAFSVRILAECDHQQRLNDAERTWIRRYNSVQHGYNFAEHGGGGGLKKYKGNLRGSSRPDEVKAKIRATLRATLERKREAVNA